MQIGKNGIDLIKSFEGIHLESYKCPAGIWTIGYGSTTWPDGKPIRQGEKITLETAEKLLAHEVMTKAKDVLPHIPKLNQNQFDSLISFAYNAGSGALIKSTLLRKVKANPSDPTIRAEFLKWNKARVNGKLTELRGLTRRRNAEADLYFKPI